MQSLVGFMDIGERGGHWERSGGGGGGGDKGKRGVETTRVGKGGVGILGIERAAERWWESTWISFSSWVVRRVVSGSRVSSSSVSE